jgi:hypothetical protein
MAGGDEKLLSEVYAIADRSDDGLSGGLPSLSG